MTVGTALARALWALGLAALLGGCASTSEVEPARAPEVTLYELDVQAPGALRTLLLGYLDLSHFQKVPSSEGVTPAEIERLVAVAPAQARSLLETEGYFEADVKVSQAPGAAGLARITVAVVPGQRVVVGSVAVAAKEPLAPRQPTREQPSKDRLDRLRRDWSLPVGAPFRQPDWSSAKNAALGALRGDGYPRAEWQDTRARVDATAASAALSVTVDAGPLFRLGAVRVEGVNRYDEEAVRRLAGFFVGEEYSERKLLDFQDRLVKIGLFEGASVELDATGPPEGAPVLVKVKELTQHQATFGVGFSANTGPRVSVEHFDRKVFGQPWIAHTTAVFGPDLKSLGTEFTSYPRENFWRNLAAANVEELNAADEKRYSVTARLGRSKDTPRFERLYYLEAAQARVQSAPLTTASAAVTANYHWLRRDLDNVLLPSEGTALSLQGAAGYGSGSLERSDRPGDTERGRGPFVRAYARFNWYRPIGGWFANARVEGGEVFVRSAVAVPDTILFRAGGDNSVRGYGYRTLGPSINGAVVGGRVLATGSFELERPFTNRLPALLGAVFVDAGNAADRWTALHPVLGYGVGVHYRSPVGPLRLDVAYGQETHRVRLHLSVGVAF